MNSTQNKSVKQTNNRPNTAKLPTLGRVLGRIHITVALVSVATAGIFLTLAALFALRVYADHNLHLVARSISYTTEAAVVFGDSVAANEALSLIAENEEVAQAKILDVDGQEVANWTLPNDGPMFDMEQKIARWALPEPVVLPIEHSGKKVGSIVIFGHGGNLLRFLLQGLAGLLICLILSTLVALFLSRRMLFGIIESLNKITEVAHNVSRHRSFGQRVPSAKIAELNELSNDFNGLLEELEVWQDHLTQENDFLAHRAAHDSLTGLANRAFFEGRLSRTLSDCAADEQLAVLFIDGDHFKEINDNYGHAAGDLVLTAIADRIRSLLRETDLVARLGGDEFAVLLAPIHNTDDVLTIANKIIDSMNQPIDLVDGSEITASISIGIAIYPDHAQTPEDLLQRADEAMYQAKKSFPSGGVITHQSDITLTESLG
ncbi:diguanylate cyclase domain-containing protein [Yersinia intermedia]|jgi:diguanylate cyclase (GGDEF)-like protein|uniref:diguanylate cyclase domain-containing protein n=1 Tax=Yersinia intermedia TaxID=631 RepID=UPI0005DCF833|nr:diguanylate cyclase [Yersinia intermedia]MCB5311315.1 diguanylate cyclase [Yersinia intermedia]MCB5321800.1 diguanylate cyclase [Yersinia intermedia]MCB5325795.1 diguanylate cyclase [Yersinia intermedia]UNK22848.1 diguanylate cyclase [Yersinia intermedia]UZM70509.1 diguanylate cyclase [Yersinia intermedia]